MVTHRSRLTAAFSHAKLWHACERYETRQLPCPLRLAEMEEDDEDGDERTPVPIRDPAPRIPTYPPLAVPVRRRIPRIPDSGGPRLPPPITYPLPIPLPIPFLPPPGLLPVPRPPPDEGPVPRQPDPDPDPIRNPVFPGFDRMDWLPDGLPIPPSDPMTILTILKENNLADDLPDPDPDNPLTPNPGEVYSIWIPRLLNLAFKAMQPLWIPGVSRQRALSDLSSGKPAANTSLANWVAASAQGEEQLVQSLTTQTMQYTNTDESTATGFIPPRFNFRSVSAAALGGAALAATGYFAQQAYGGGGFIAPGAVSRIMNPGGVR